MVPLVMMLIISFLLLPHNFAAQASPVATICEADILINVEKGFVVQRIGTYSHKVHHAIIHTFVSLNDLCKSLPGTDVCIRASGLFENSIELGSILSTSEKHWSFSNYEKKNISELITQEIYSVLSNNKPEQFLSNIPTNFHFFNGNFYVYTPNHQSTDSTVHFADERKESLINNQKNTPLIVLEQLKNHRIGFNFLKEEEVRVFLSPIMQSIEKSYQTANVQQLVADFTPLIVSQTVNAFRRCSINQNDLSSPSCLIVSTLFTMPSSSPVDKYTTYNILPIPIFLHGYQYTYNNLPKMVAYNDDDQSMIVFDNYLQSKCIVSKIIQCSIEPMLMSLSQIPCLSHMFLTEPSQPTDCEVTRRAGFQFPVLHIVQNIWIFNNQDTPERCTMQLQETTNKDSSNMRDLVLYHMPCGKSVRCFNHRIWSSKCDNTTIMIMDKDNGLYKPQSNFHINLTPLKQNILAKYKNDMISLLNEIKAYDDDNVTTITRLYRRFFNLIICIVILFLTTIISICAKLIQKKIQQQLHIVHRSVNNLTDIFLDIDDEE